MDSKRLLLAGVAVGAALSFATVDTATAATKHHRKPVADHAAAAAAATTAEIQALRQQVAALQARLDAQAAAQAESQAKLAAIEAKTQVVAAKADQAQDSIQRIPAEVTEAVAANTPKTDKLHVKGVSITLGGFLAAEGIYRSSSLNADMASSFNSIPYANSPYAHTQELRGSARQSRLSALVQGDVDANTHLGFYGEFDFLGAAQTANSNESNSYTPRIRNVYGTVDWDNLGLHLLAGQNWSLVTMNSKGITPRNELTPPQIDAQYIPGFTWARQPQIRLTKDFADKTLWIAASLENPQTTFYTGANGLPPTVHLTYNAPAGSGFNSANTLSLNHIPDGVLKVAYEPTIGDRTIHIEAYGLFRAFYERLNGEDRNVYGGGFGAGIVVPVLPKLLDVQVSGLTGRGIGRYGSGQLPDVTFDAQGDIKPIDETALLIGATLHATPKLDVYLFGGEERASSKDFVDATGIGYGYGNPLYVNAGCFAEGLTSACVGNTRSLEQVTAGFWHKVYNGNFGRMQWGIQYSYTERKAFEGVGGAPSADDNMVFTSFRYYPF